MGDGHDGRALGAANAGQSRRAGLGWAPRNSASSPASCATRCAPATTFEEINQQLIKVVNLKLRDESAKRRARRKYVGIMMNDFVLNPGPSDEPIEQTEGVDPENFGLMSSFLTRWSSRLPEFLASGAGLEIRVPPGNSELTEIIQRYENPPV
jgi:hypothetical protein